MVERVERRFNLRPERLVGDTVYGVARLLRALVDRKITPHVPVWDKSARHDGTFSRADFVFEPFSLTNLVAEELEPVRDMHDAGLRSRLSTVSVSVAARQSVRSL